MFLKTTKNILQRGKVRENMNINYTNWNSSIFFEYYKTILIAVISLVLKWKKKQIQRK